MIYEFKCPCCGTEEEIDRKMSDDSPVFCQTTECVKESIQMKKQVSGGNFILKGDGWYRDGYAKKS